MSGVTAPTQALLLMNSPFITDQSASWAEKLLEISKAAAAALTEHNNHLALAICAGG